MFLVKILTRIISLTLMFDSKYRYINQQNFIFVITYFIQAEPETERIEK